MELSFFSDYSGRGKQFLETICLLLAYKVKYLKDVFLMSRKLRMCFDQQDFADFMVNMKENKKINEDLGIILSNVSTVYQCVL